jgi:hypothetical protein
MPRVPSVPLVTHDPYFSIWSTNDRLTDESTRHWTGSSHPLTGLIRVDGRPFRFMGGAVEGADVPAMPQTGLEITPTQTRYRFNSHGVQLMLTFTSPLLPDDIEVLSRPVTYVTLQTRSTDAKSHHVDLWFDASPLLAVNAPEQNVQWNRAARNAGSWLRAGTVEQPVLQKAGDNLRIDWGHLYLSAPRNGQPGIVTPAARSAWAREGLFPTSDESGAPRPATSAPLLAVRFNLGRVRQRASTRHLLIAYDDEYSIQLMGRKLRPFWRRTGMDASQLLRVAEADYAKLLRRCAAFDQQLTADANRIGGAEYARLVALAYRQTLAAHKVAAGERGNALHFSKENFSNGCIATVDVTYPASPFFLLLNPTLLKGQLTPVLDYAASPRWKWPFAPHDLGTYPKANGQVYGGGERTEENQMPVEESGNMLIMLAALARVEGNAHYSNRYWPQLEKWANYLREKGMDPENQLSTDDFAGHLAHNTNLSIKAIEALGGFAQLCAMTGRQAQAQQYRAVAQEMAQKWIGLADDGDHFRLAFDKPGTWSQKYNLVWDKILGINLFPASVARKELAYYATKQNRYGLPLDNRRGYTKLDWIVWTATLADSPQQFRSFIVPLDRFLNDTPNRVPLTDWFETGDARMSGFQARSVVGGVMMPFLNDLPNWNRWVKRAGNVRPLRPDQIRIRTSEVAGSAERSKINWRYTMQQPATDWMNTQFNNATWQSGFGGFGTLETPGAIIGTKWNTSDIWLRRTIDLPANFATSTARHDMYLWLHHDEDAEVYINGVLAARVSGFTSSYEEVPISAAGRAALKAGTNVLAIHCRQTRGGQYIDAGLVHISEKTGG